MKSTLFALVVAVAVCTLLAGCPTMEPQIERPIVKTETVTVPVAVMRPIPAPPVLIRPALSVHEISAADGHDQLSKRYARTIEQLGKYALELEEIIEAYRDLAARQGAIAQ